jgi:hypothetical protein
VVFIIRAADGVPEAYDWIEQLLDKLGDFSIRLQEYNSEDFPKHLRAKVVQIRACVLQILSQSEKAIIDKLWKRHAALVFVGKDEVIKASFESLECLFEEEQRLVTAITYTTTQRMAKRVEVLQETGDELLATSKSVDAKVDEELQRKHRADILCWLLPTDFSAQHSDNLERKQEGSGLWFLDVTIFKEWKTGSNTTLFCPGMPGAGKTMMATSVIDHLLVVAQDKIDAVAYIYCDYKNRTDQNPKRLFATILRQLVQSRNTVPASLLALYKDRQNRGGSLIHSEIINELRQSSRL